jgi:hypothetical protein
MTPTPEHLQAAREWLEHRTNFQLESIAALLASTADKAYKKGQENMRKRCRIVALNGATDRCYSHEQSGQGACGHDIRDAIAVLPIRALEPPSGEGE